MKYTIFFFGSLLVVNQNSLGGNAMSPHPNTRLFYFGEEKKCDMHDEVKCERIEAKVNITDFDGAEWISQSTPIYAFEVLWLSNHRLRKLHSIRRRQGIHRKIIFQSLRLRALIRFDEQLPNATPHNICNKILRVSLKWQMHSFGNCIETFSNQILRF